MKASRHDKTVFIDTGAFYARYVVSDNHHDAAVKKWRTVGESFSAAMTTNLVVCETVTLLAYRFGSGKALIAAREIYASHFVTVESVTRAVELEALDWLEKFADQKFSMTDAVSFAIMHAKGIKRAFSFDRHFRIAGFETV